MGFQSCSKPPQGGLFLLECVPIKKIMEVSCALATKAYRSN